MTDVELVAGDAAAVLGGLPDASVDLIVADPPYNLGKHYGNNIDRREAADYAAFTRAWTGQAARVLKPQGTLYSFMGMRFIARLYLMLEEELGLAPNGWITWHYTQGMGRTRGFSPRHEDILCFVKGHDYHFDIDAVRVPQKYFRKRNNMAGANPGDVWTFSHVHYCAGERTRHPTQKPEALIERLVRASSKPGDMIVDPFVGSGTTARVAQVLGRRCLGIDINPDYVEMSRHRLLQPFEGFDSVDPRLDRRPLDMKAAAE
ncbi:MAG: site-specific DNA-methyltransferase [Alphaproteobacteria bacterium]|nr:site-specific DNA-methyltransferase [Alphaproteobacteria bacterium]